MTLISDLSRCKTLNHYGRFI